MSKTKLRECPFCGSLVGPVVDGNEWDVWDIWCKECSARGPATDTKRKAVNAWNRRGTPPSSASKETTSPNKERDTKAWIDLTEKD